MFGLPGPLPRARDHVANARGVGAAAGLVAGVLIRSAAPRERDVAPHGLAEVLRGLETRAALRARLTRNETSRKPTYP